MCEGISPKQSPIKRAKLTFCRLLRRWKTLIAMTFGYFKKAREKVYTSKYFSQFVLYLMQFVFDVSINE
jgi:hypothetical protein